MDSTIGIVRVSTFINNLKSMRKFFLSVLLALIPYLANAQALVFIGTPNVKIIENGVERSLEKVEKSKELSLACVVREIDGRFYWESRGNRQLLKTDSGAFVTYAAVDGSGYIRAIKPSMKDAASIMSVAEKNFDYIEHLLLGLRTVTYYGKLNSSNLY
jgi:hypothetical protein